MNPFEMLVAIAFLGVVGSVFNTLIKSRQERREGNEASAHDADELREQLLALEERIRVLERIVTDAGGREDLRRQFRDLER